MTERKVQLMSIERMVIKMPRLTAFLKMPPAVVEDCLQQVEKHFDKNWLMTKGEHRLQTLWDRTDSNSTIELVSLGYALETLSKSHPVWLKGCIGDITSNDVKRQNGALFELNLVSWFINGEMNVFPASYAEQGIDATLKFAGTDDLFVSMKNHDMSHHEETLHKNCEVLRAKARELCKRQGGNGVTVTLTAKEYLSSQSDWDALGKALDEWPVLTKDIEERQVSLGIHLFVGLLDAKANNLDIGYISDNFATFMPYHKNEQPNFKQKLRDAISQLKKKCADRVGKKAVFMRLHQTCNMTEMIEFATDLINEPGCAADFIALYQPAFIQDPVQNTTSPSQYISVIPAPGFDASKYPIKMQSAISVRINNPSQQKIAWPDGSLKDPPANHYMHAIGQHFVAMTSTGNPNGEASVNVTRRPNLTIIPVFNGNLVTGLMPPNDEFLIL